MNGAGAPPKASCPPRRYQSQDRQSYGSRLDPMLGDGANAQHRTPLQVLNAVSRVDAWMCVAPTPVPQVPNRFRSLDSIFTALNIHEARMSGVYDAIEVVTRVVITKVHAGLPFSGPKPNAVLPPCFPDGTGAA